MSWDLIFQNDLEIFSTPGALNSVAAPFEFLSSLHALRQGYRERTSMSIDADRCKTIFSQAKLDTLFPPERSNQFFEALFGDAAEGAYDIRLAFHSVNGNQMQFDFELHQRPGKCLACNLTYGLPQVFERHPIINTQGVVEQLCGMLNGDGACSDWKLGKANEISRALHVVPLIITFDPS